MMKKNPLSFNSVSSSAKRYKRHILKAISKVIDSGTFFGGEEARKLESSLKKVFGNKGYLTLTSSGHDALSLALSSMHLKKDDEVIFPVNAYPTAFPVFLSKGKPVPCDVDENGQLDPQELNKLITKKTKAVIIVHLYGLAGNLKEIKKTMRSSRIFVIEDCAQALIGSKYQDQLIGTFGDISCFSFYPTKNLGTLGDGGAIWTKHRKTYEYIKMAKSYGEKKRNFSIFVSGHSRIPEIQTAILNIYFNNLSSQIQKRKDLYDYYKKMIKKNHLDKLVRILESSSGSDVTSHLFVIEVGKRDGLKKHLEKKGIKTFIHYPYPIHRLPAFNLKKLSFPQAERLAKRILSLPSHPFMKREDVEYIAKSIRDFYYD